MSHIPSPSPSDDELDRLLHAVLRIPVSLSHAMRSIPPISAPHVLADVYRSSIHCKRPGDSRHALNLSLTSEAIVYFYDAINRRELPDGTVFTLMYECAQSLIGRGAPPHSIHTAVRIATASANDQLRNRAIETNLSNTQLLPAQRALEAFANLLLRSALPEAPPQEPSSNLLLFGPQLRSVREWCGLTQEALAARLGFHRSYIGQIERGELSPTLDTADRISRVLNTSVANLLVG